MQADRRDRNHSRQSKNQGKQTLIIVVAAIILVAGALLLLPGDDEQPPPVAEPLDAPAPQPPRPDPAENIIAAPDIPEVVPEPEPEAMPEAEPTPPPPPPTTEEIDAQLREALTESSNGPDALLAPALAAPFLLDRGVSAIDQIARGYVPIRALNIARPNGKFTVRREGQQRYVDEKSYARYDTLVESLTTLSPQALADNFQSFRSLLGEAYAALGYPADAVDNATIAALDEILAAPVLRDPIKVESKGALWAYADPNLESRSDLHKQLMRMGPDNLEILQRWAQDLRIALLQ
jgi:hypothetical protein